MFYDITAKGLYKYIFFKAEFTMEVGGCVGPTCLTRIFWGKSSVLIFWSSIPCVFCLYNIIGPTLLKVVSYYDISVLPMSVMGFQKKFGWGCGWVGGWVWGELYSILFWIFGIF